MTTAVHDKEYTPPPDDLHEPPVTAIESQEHVPMYHLRTNRKPTPATVLEAIVQRHQGPDWLASLSVLTCTWYINTWYLVVHCIVEGAERVTFATLVTQYDTKM